MNEQLQKDAVDIFNGISNAQQFGASKIPAHRHNDIDAQRISFTDLKDRRAVLSYTLFGTQAATAGNYSVFFVAPYSLSVIQITEVHTALGTDGGAVSLDLENLSGTTAPGSGTKMTASPFNLKGTINTVVAGTLSTAVGALSVPTGNRIALLLTGTPTSVANVTVTILYRF